MQLTAEALREVCKQNKQYISCPELNDVLYLNYKGIEKIEALEVSHWLPASSWGANLQQQEQHEWYGQQLQASDVRQFTAAVPAARSHTIPALTYFCNLHLSYSYSLILAYERCTWSPMPSAQ